MRFTVWSLGARVVSSAGSSLTRYHLKAMPDDSAKNKIQKYQQTADLPARFDGLHLPRVSRDAAVASDDDTHRDTDGGDVCFRQHDQ